MAWSSASCPASPAAFPDGNHVDGDQVEFLDFGRFPADGLGDFAFLRLLGVVEPLAQFAFLGAGQGEHLRGVLGALLDQCEGLQHRVVQVRGDVGAFGGAHPVGAFGDVVAPETQPPREQHQGQARDHRHRDGQPGEQFAQSDDAAEEKQQPGDHQVPRR